MLTLLLALGALPFIGLSYVLVRKTSPYTRAGGDAYVRRQKRKLIGITMLFPAGLLVVVAIVRYLAVTPESLPPPPDTSEPYVPPVVSRPSEDDPIAGREAPMNLDTSGGAAQSRATESLPLTIDTRPAENNPVSARGATLPTYLAPTATSPGAAPALSSPASTASPIVPSSSQNQTMEQKVDAELNLLNAAIRVDPKNANAYGELGNIYASRQSWLEAETNYKKALELDGTNSSVKYNLAQMQFVQRKYDDARPGFAAMQKDEKVGDLALYKTFLCDLYGGHDDVAAKELDAFNQAGENASYYFANVASSLYHKKNDEARDWLASATRIYSPQKLNLYTADLFQLGYLPIPPPQ